MTKKVAVLPVEVTGCQLIHITLNQFGILTTVCVSNQSENIQ